MNWLDVAGVPGVGKSKLCDSLWSPHAIDFRNAQPVAEWHDFYNEITRLLGLVKDHPTFTAAVRMNRRSARKMAAVALGSAETFNTVEPGLYGWRSIYIQTGFLQRGLGFGWRFVDMKQDINELRHFFRLMPVSLGVAMLRCDPEIVKERNKAREAVEATAHENRAFMVELMEPAIELATECLAERCGRVLVIDTGKMSADAARQEIVRTAQFWAEQDGILGNTPATRSGGEVPVLSVPQWW